MNFAPALHQAAGHAGSLSAGSVFAKVSSAAEIDFYTELVRRFQDAETPLGSLFFHWMPTFMGTLSQGKWDHAAQEDAMALALPNTQLPASLEQYVVLSNLYHSFVQPCILDIKIGALLTDEDASQEKKERMARVSASTTSGSLGFRICGMRVLSDGREGPLAALKARFPGTILLETLDNCTYDVFDKNFGKAIKDNDVVDALRAYFPAHHTSLLVERFIQRLQLVYNSLVDLDVRIRSGSLLFIYEGNLERWKDVNHENYFDLDPLVAELADEDSDTESTEASPLSALNFIDFAHAKYVYGQGPDNDVLDGLENVLQNLSNLQEQTAQKL